MGVKDTKVQLHWLNELYSNDISKSALSLIHTLISMAVSLPNHSSDGTALTGVFVIPHILLIFAIIRYLLK